MSLYCDFIFTFSEILHPKSNHWRTYRTAGPGYETTQPFLEKYFPTSTFGLSGLSLQYFGLVTPMWPLLILNIPFYPAEFQIRKSWK